MANLGRDVGYETGVVLLAHLGKSKCGFILAPPLM